MLYRFTLCTAAALLSCTAANATPIRQSAGPVQQVLVASDIASQTTSANCSVGYVDVPDAFVRITIPAGGNQLLVARFNGRVSALDPTAGNSSTLLRLVVGTRELNPAGGVNVMAESTGSFIQPPATMERSGPIAPGAHVVKAQYCADGDSNATATVREWHLTVEAAPLP